MKGTKGKSKKGKTGKGKGKKDNGEAKANAWTDDSSFAGGCGYCGKWRNKKAQCWKQKDKGNKHPATTVQAVATENQAQTSQKDIGSF